MFSYIAKHIISFLTITLLGVILMDYIVLPSYVGYNNEHYLPDIRGEYIEKANIILTNLGFQVRMVTAPYSNYNIPGTIIKMHPRAFTKVKEGRVINLTIAGKMEDIELPNITLNTLRNAQLKLSKIGLNIDTVVYEYDNDIEKGYITFQVPRAGKIVKSFSKITLGVSKGMPPDYYIIPDIINLSYDKARKKIINTGLRVGMITYEYNPDLLINTVLDQSLTPGMRVSFPASINLIVSTDKIVDK